MLQNMMIDMYEGNVPGHNKTQQIKKIAKGENECWNELDLMT